MSNKKQQTFKDLLLRYLLFKFKVVLTDCNSNLMFIFCNNIIRKILIELAGS